MHFVFCCFCCSYLCFVVQVSVGNPHPVVSVLGSCYSGQGSPHFSYGCLGNVLLCQFMLQWHREGPHLVVSVLGSCYSRWIPFRVICVLPCRCQQGALIPLFRFWVAVTQDKGPPTSPTGAWEMCCCVSSCFNGTERAPTSLFRFWVAVTQGGDPSVSPAFPASVSGEPPSRCFGSG